jgi:acyl-CoA thioesterase FadM
MLWTAIASRFRSRVGIQGTCLTPFRVWPTDLDVLMHVNNGVYFSMMDVARFDLMFRCGFVGTMRRRGWYPVVTAETIQFRRSLLPFQAFAIETRLLGFDDKSFVVEQRFLRAGDPKPVAQALVRGQFLSRGGGSVPVTELLAAAGAPTWGPMPAHAAQWSADQAASRIG